MVNTLSNTNRLIKTYAAEQGWRVATNPDDPQERIIPSRRKKGLQGFWALNSPTEWCFFHPNPPPGYRRRLRVCRMDDRSGDDEAYYLTPLPPDQVPNLPRWAQPYPRKGQGRA